MHAFLIIKTSALGDVVHTLPVLHYLRARFPDARIDWVVEKGSVGFLSAQNLGSVPKSFQCSGGVKASGLKDREMGSINAIQPVSRSFSRESFYTSPSIENFSVRSLVDHVIPVNTRAWRKGKDWSGMRGFYRTLRSVEYDAVFDLQGNSKSALMTLCARAKAKVGFAWGSVPEKPNLLATNTRFEAPEGINVRARYLHVVQSFFKDSAPFQVERAASGAEKEKKLMVCFGSKWPNKQLSVTTWIAFLQRVQEETGLDFVFVWGDAAEKAVAEELQRAFPEISETLGSMSLTEWQQEMEKMAGVIAVDSVGLHLAGITSTPSFSVFGPSSAAVYKPEGERHGAFQGACPYGVCFAQRCPKLRTCSTGACLKELDQEKLFDAFVIWWRVNQSLYGSLPHRSLPSPSPHLPCTALP